MSFVKMKFFIAIILLTACAAVQGRSVQVHPNISMLDYGIGTDSRIIDGHDAGPGLLPWHAALSISRPTGTYMCGGSLISDKWILTAAHCVRDATSVEVQLGGVNLWSDMEYKEISYNFLSHEDFELGPNATSAINDIALIELPVPATLSVNVQIIPLPARSHPDPAGSTVRVSGHGLTIEGGTSNILQYVDLTAITNAACAKYYKNLLPSDICAHGAPHHNSCKGDSGGPLVQYNLSTVQVGIVSYGMGCTLGVPSVYARVTSFLDWINQHTGIPIRD